MDGIIRNSLSELLPMTKGENGINTVNARDLYAFLGSKQHFADWIKNRIEQYGFLENQDFQGICDAHAFSYCSIICLILRGDSALSSKTMCNSPFLAFPEGEAVTVR